MIRSVQENDVFDLHRIHTKSVSELCVKDYSQEQIQAWVAGPVEHYKKSIEQVPYSAVYEYGGSIAGYILLKSDYSIWQLYIDPIFSKRGIGSALLNSALDFIKSKKIKSIWLQSSITAVPFYEKHGFSISKYQTIQKNGVDLPTVLMVKIIS